MSYIPNPQADKPKSTFDSVPSFLLGSIQFSGRSPSAEALTTFQSSQIRRSEYYVAFSALIYSFRRPIFSEVCDLCGFPVLFDAICIRTAPSEPTETVRLVSFLSTTTDGFRVGKALPISIVRMFSDSFLAPINASSGIQHSCISFLPA